MKNVKSDKTDTIKDIKIELNKKILKNITKKWAKSCPECGMELNYSSKRGLMFSIKNNTLCRKCSKTGNRNPYFGKTCIWKGLVGPNKGKQFGNDFRLKISKIVKGRKHTNQSKIKMSLSNIGKNIWSKGRNISDDTKQKLRQRRIEDLRKKGIFPGSTFSKNYNINACKFIEDFGKKTGHNFQHALNGGEIELCGYFVDGYDKEKNVIFEYDEPHHYDVYGNLKRDDLYRQNIIIEKYKPNKFFRYNEEKQNLYEVIVRKEK